MNTKINYDSLIRKFKEFREFMNRTSVNLRDSNKLPSDVQDNTNMTEDNDKHYSN